MPLQGIIFDLDGTLVDSALDFDAMRVDLGFHPNQPILEAIECMPFGADRDRCLDIVHQHEVRGANRATLMPGVTRFLDRLRARGMKLAILTRNSSHSTELTLQRLKLSFDPVITRDHAPPKPDPTGLLNICKAWNCEPHEAVYIGDFLFDIQAGHNAGMQTIFYSAANEPPDYAHQADHILHSFNDADELLAQIDSK